MYLHKVYANKIHPLTTNFIIKKLCLTSVWRMSASGFSLKCDRSRKTWDETVCSTVIILHKYALHLICISPCWHFSEELSHLSLFFHGLLKFLQNGDVCKRFQLVLQLFGCEKIWPVIFNLTMDGGGGMHWWISVADSMLLSLTDWDVLSYPIWPLSTIEVFLSKFLGDSPQILEDTQAAISHNHTSQRPADNV